MFIFFNKHFLNTKQKQEIISSFLVSLNTLDLQFFNYIYSYIQLRDDDC